MKKLLALGLGLGMLCASCGSGPNAGELNNKKLQIFILAGQSNMVGHANYITIPALLRAEEPGVKELAKLIFKKGKIAAGMAKDLIETRIKRDKLNGELRAKKMAGDDKIAPVQAELKKLQAEYDAKCKRIKDSFAISKRVYISSIADGHRRSGPLTIGYSGSTEGIGPELGFGLALEQAVDAPILLIKTSWGGKSLHYDFRPPSSGPYKLDERQKKLETDEYKQAWGKAQAEYANVWRPKAKKAIAAFWAKHDKFMAGHLDKERYAEWRKTAAAWHARCASAGSGGPDNLRPWKVWELERKAQECFWGTKIKAPTMNYKETLWKERPALAGAPSARGIRDNAGLNYRMMNAAVREVLEDLKKHHPEYDAGAGYDIAGFVWFQGFNDQFSPAYYGNYKNNMIAFVKDVRREYNVANMPFVIGVLGTGGTKENVDKNAVSVAQRQAAAAPGFKGNVASVESYPFYETRAAEMWSKGTWNKPEHRVEFGTIASDRPYHYMGSGKFFVRLGDALATSMVDLMKKQK